MTAFALGRALRRPHCQSGQMTIESVLILVVLASFGLAASRAFQEQQILQSIVGSPWAHMRGMIENGIWSPATPNSFHPNSKKRHASTKPE